MMVLFIFIKSLKKWGFLLLVLPGCFLLFVSCNSDQTDQYPSKTSADNDLPDHIRELENLTIYSPDTQDPDTVELIKETVYGDSGEVVFGRIGTIAVDSSGRVFTTDVQKQVIYVFEPDGWFTEQLGGEGQGPGEFVSVPALYIVSNRLYAIDIRAFRISVFSVDSLKLIRTVNINPTNQIKALADYYIHQIIPEKDGTFLVSFKKFLREVPGLPEGTKIDTLYRSYYPMDKEGRLIPKQVLKIKEEPIVTESIFQNVFPVNLNFFRKPFVAVSNDESIYVANSKDFLIKEYSPGGQYLRAFFHPYQNVSLTRETALESSHATMSKLKLMPGRDISESMIQTMINSRQRLIRQIDLPPNWPAMNDLFVDDENRLWVSTIVEDFEIYEWWVLEETGELITKFEWPRDEPIEVVQNGYMYTRETDEETGLQQVVRYRIGLTEK